jgi:hypothetical protein
MHLDKKHVVMLVLVIIILSVPMNASATVDVSSGYKGQGQTVFIAMHYECVSPVGHIQARLEQDLIALEYAFAKLQNEGFLDPDFPRLVIVAGKHFNIDKRFEIAPTVLSLTNTAILVCNNHDSRKFAPENLGPTYVIRTSIGLLSYEDLAAMMIHLGGLNEATPAITIESEEKLLTARNHPTFKEIMNLSVRIDEENITSGNLRLSTLWDAGKTQFSLLDEAGNTIKELEPVDIYIGRPSWPPAERSDMQGRLIAYASKDKAIIYDIVKGKYYELNLDFEYKDPDAKKEAAFIEYENVEFTMHPTENKVFVLPFGSRGMIIITYSLDLNTGKWVRELEGRVAHDIIWENKFNGTWYDFVSAVNIRRILNMAILTSDEEIAFYEKYFGQNIVNDDEDQADAAELPIKDQAADTEKNDIQEETSVVNEALDKPEIPLTDKISVNDESVTYDDTVQSAEESVGQEGFNRAWWLLLIIFPAAALIFFFRNWRKA